MMKAKHWALYWIGTIIIAGGFWGVGWYERTQFFSVISGEMGTRKMMAAILCLITAVFAALVCLLGGVINRRKNRKYGKIREYAENYLKRQEEAGTVIEEGCKKWMEKEMDRNALAQALCLLWMFLWLGIYIVCSGQSWRFPAFIIAVMAGVVFYYWRLIAVQRKIGQVCSGKDTALEGFWCCLRLHNFGGKMETRMTILDMNMAVCLANLKDYEASRELAELIWSAFGRKRSRGVYYVQYHFLQWRNAFALKDEQEAQKHMGCVESELSRVPKNKFYIRVNERIREIKGQQEE